MSVNHLIDLVMKLWTRGHMREGEWVEWFNSALNGMSDSCGWKPTWSWTKTELYLPLGCLRGRAWIFFSQNNLKIPDKKICLDIVSRDGRCRDKWVVKKQLFGASFQSQVGDMKLNVKYYFMHESSCMHLCIITACISPDLYHTAWVPRSDTLYWTLGVLHLAP